MVSCMVLTHDILQQFSSKTHLQWTRMRYGKRGCLSSYSISRVYKILSHLTGVAQWIECWPANQSITGWIPSQGTRLGCGPGPQLGACERQPIDVSLT